jgi:hypothetical protein
MSGSYSGGPTFDFPDLPVRVRTLMTIKSLLRVATVFVLALPVRIAAQAPDGPVNTPPGVSPTTGGGQGGGSAPAGSSVGSNGGVSQSFPQFGAWLDDATLEGRGTGRLTIGAGYWRTADGRQIDVPMIDAGYDISDRIRVSAFVPFYRARYGAELTTGVDDVYLSTKVILVNAAKDGGHFGLAVSPALEVLSSGYTTGDRVHWVLPFSAEVRPTQRIRIYSTGGYFSRGAAFGGVAAEWTAPTASVIWVSLTDSYALETGTDLTLTTSDRHLSNVAIGLTQLINERLAAYVSVGRTMSDTSSGSPTIGVGAGISIRFSRSKAVP